MRRSIFLPALVIAACGGGGGESAPLPPIADGGLNPADEEQGTISVDLLSLQFDPPCGVAVTKTFTVTNTSPSLRARVGISVSPAIAPAIVMDEISGPFGQELNVEELNLLPSTSRTFKVKVRDDAPPGRHSRTVVIASKTLTKTLHLDAVVRGAVLVPTAPKAFFGGVRQGLDSEPYQVSFTNEGNEPVTVDGVRGLTNDFSTSWVGPQTVAPRTSIEIPVRVKAGPAFVDPVDASLELVTSKTCTSSSVMLRAVRVDDLVTVFPGAVELGSVRCGQPLKTAKLVLSNFDTVNSVTYSAAAATDAYGDQVVLEGTTAGTLPPAASPTQPSTAIVLAKTAPPALGKTLSGFVNISTSSSPLGLSAQVRAFPAGARITAGTVPLNPKQFQIQNDGDVPALLHLQQAPDSFELPSELFINARSTIREALVPRTQPPQPTSLTIAAVAETPLCAPIVNPIPIAP